MAAPPGQWRRWRATTEGGGRTIVASTVPLNLAEGAEEVILGVDTHRDTHVAAVISAMGKTLAVQTFPATAVGYDQLIEWAAPLGVVRRAGVEGSGNYGDELVSRYRSLSEEFYGTDRVLARKQAFAAFPLGLVSVLVSSGALVYALATTATAAAVGRLAAYTQAINLVQTSAHSVLFGIGRLRHRSGKDVRGWLTAVDRAVAKGSPGSRLHAQGATGGARRADRVDRRRG